MSQNINQITTAATSILATDKLYLGRSPFDLTDDRYILGSAIIAQFAPLTTKGDLFGFSTVNARLPVAVGDGKVLMVNSAAALGVAYSTPTYPPISGTAGQIIRSNGTDNIYSTATFPDLAGTSGNVMVSNGTNWNSSATTGITALGAQAQALNMNTHLINGVVDPVSAQDAATKNYVDTFIQGLLPKPSSAAASTVALTVTYANGSSGVGATLTNAGAQAAFAIDGYTAALNDVILIKDQASTFQNGLYTVTTLGSGASNWVLTRSTSMDIGSEFKGGYTFIINGTVNAGRSYVETATVVTVGTDAVTFTQFSSSKVLSLNLVTVASTGTYTPSTGMFQCKAMLQGAGGGGGGAGGAGGNVGQGGGGGGGGYCEKLYTSALIGASAAVTLAAGGAGGSAGNNNGTAASNSTFVPSGAGATLTAGGGGAGNGMAATIPSNTTAGGSFGSATGGDTNIPGGTGEGGVAVAGATGACAGGGGGDSWLGTFTANKLTGGYNANGSAFGGGGVGACANSGANVAGGNGAIGVCYVLEYILT